MKNFFKRRKNWIILFIVILIMIVVSFIPKDKGFYKVAKNLFDINKFDIIEIEYTYYRNSGIVKDFFKKNEGVWIDKGNNIINVDDIDNLLTHIVNLKYVGIKEKVDEHLLNKWQITKPNYEFSVKTQNTKDCLKILVGTDAEEKGYYYVAVENNISTIYIIKDYLINSIINQCKKLLRKENEH